MKSFKAYTLIELLVGFMIGTVMILMIGSVLSIGTLSHKKVRDEGEIFSDLSYSFRFLRNRVREASSIAFETAYYAPWEGTRLILGQSAFGIIDAGDRKNFIYAAHKDDTSQNVVLVSVRKQDDNFLTFYFTPYGNRIDAYLGGKRDKIPFNFSGSIMKRAENE